MQKCVKCGKRHRYDMQGQFYRLACESQKIPAPAFAIVGQEKEPPYAASVHLFPESNHDETVADLDGAKDIVRGALRKFERCTTDGEWSAYGETLFMAQVPSDASAGSHN